ncbi:MAG: efflux RND transporter periplasmic adaptor subunit [Acidobacteria bacterium]|nr:efflux RND transporter periplasmic adaptor subunit [Acidobacteriota bacterium]
MNPIKKEKSRFVSFLAALPVPLGIALAALLVLAANGWAHGEIAGSGQRNLERIVEGRDGWYRVELMHSPALPTADEPTNIELKVTRLLPEPDPLLGSEVPVALTPEVSVLYAGSRKLLDPHLPLHAEGEAGIFGAEYHFPDHGSLLLRISIHTETDDELSVDFNIVVERNMAAFFRFWVNFAVSILILVLTGMQLWKVREKGGRLAQMLRPLSIGALSWVVVYLGMSFFVLDQVLALREPKIIEGSAETVTTNDDGSYTIPVDIQQELGIVLVEAKQRSLDETFSAFGTVEANPLHSAEVVAPLWGRIEFADESIAVGDQVRRGQLLVYMVLELSQLERFPMVAKHNDILGSLQKATERKEAAELEHERAQKLFAANPLFEQDLEWAKELLAEATDAYEEIVTQEKNYVGVMEWRDPRKTPVVSPINGAVTSVDFIPGQVNLFDEYRKLFTIVDTSEVWVRGAVYVSDAVKLQIGQRVLVYPQSNPSRPLRATVHYIDDRVNPVNRTLSVLLDVPNPQEQLFLGGFVRMEFQQPRRQAIAVPEQAVVDDGAIQWIYVAMDEETFLPLEVEMGIRKEGWWQVVSGLQEGDRVIGKGAALLGSLRQSQPETPAASHSPATQTSSSLLPAEP